MLLICSAKVQLVGCTFAPPFLLPAITPLLLGVSWGVVAELARLVGPRVYVEFLDRAPALSWEALVARGQKKIRIRTF